MTAADILPACLIVAAVLASVVRWRILGALLGLALASASCGLVEGIGSYSDRGASSHECPTPQIPWECWFYVSETPGATAHYVRACAETTAEAWDLVRRSVAARVCSISCVPYDPNNPQPKPQGDACEAIATCADEGSACASDGECCSGLYCDQTCVL